MSGSALNKPQASEVLGEAVLNVRSHLGLTLEQLGQILGRDRSSIQRAGIDPQTPAGQLAALLIRVYRSGLVLTGDESSLKHWLKTPNRALGARPRDLLFSLQGIVNLVEYLDAHRGKL